MNQKLWILIAALGLGNLVQAQVIEEKWGEDSVKCRENLYIYYELARNKNYAEAFDSWKYVYENCPASSKNNFIYGPYIVEAKIKQTESEAEKNQLVEMLMEVYDNRLVYFPEKEDYVLERKALDMLQYWPDSTKRAFEIFKRALELDKQHSAAFYNGYFIAAARLFNDDVFEIGDVFHNYNVVIEGIEYNTDALNRQIRSLQPSDSLSDEQQKKLAKAERELARYDDVASNINKILGPIATCDKLKLIYNEESFAENKTDTTWLRRAASMLSRERTNDEGEEVTCTDNPIFFKVAEALYKLNPSVQAARAMYVLSVQNENYSKAVDYIKEAAQKEVDIRKQAKDYLRLASTYQQLGRLSEAVSAARKAASVSRNWGKPYIMLASLYAQGENQCGSNVFEKKAVYWAAINKLQFAKSIDPSVASQANRLIGLYKQQLPEKSVIFRLGVKEGDKHSIGCYINETITVDYSI